MTCPLCGQRRARRACPALARQICPTCCGTKRLREIDCPSDCGYLVSAKAHPPAVVQRQRERDMALLLRFLEGLSRPQLALFSHVQRHVQRYRPSAIPAVHDTDLGDAAEAMASTLETAARGIVYEHQPASLPSQRLLGLFREVHTEIESRGPVPPAALAAVFRRLEWGCRHAGPFLGGGDTAFLDFVERMAAGAAQHEAAGGQAGPDRAEDERPDPPRIIVP